MQETINNDALFRALIASALDGVIVVDEKGLVQVYNSACEALFGYKPEEIIGRNVEILLPPFYREDDTFFENYLRPGGRRLIIGQRSDGSAFPLELAVSALAWGAGKLFAVFVRDVTERRGAEHRLQELQAELLQASGLSAMGQVSSAIAHELNQPLTAIMNYIGAAQIVLGSSGPAAIARAQEINQKVVGQVQRAGAIIRNLRLRVENRESRKSPESLNMVVEEAIALAFAGAAHLHIKLRLDLDAALPPVAMDKIQIGQVLINLIRNAIEAMQAMEKRELSVTTRPGEPGFVEILVRDSGPGLPEEVRKNLFQAFATTKGGGMGIGLAVCQSIVAVHGGSIWALPESSPGTTFCFRLPIVSELETPA